MYLPTCLIYVYSDQHRKRKRHEVQQVFAPQQMLHMVQVQYLYNLVCSEGTVRIFPPILLADLFSIKRSRGPCTSQLSRPCLGKKSLENGPVSLKPIRKRKNVLLVHLFGFPNWYFLLILWLADTIWHNILARINLKTLLNCLSINSISVQL